MLFIFISLEIRAEAAPFVGEIETNGYNRDNLYNSYVDKYINSELPEKEIKISGVSFSSKKDADVEILNTFESESNVLRWNSQTGLVEWTADIPEDGLYNIGMKYYPLSGRNFQIEFALEIDGKAPFDEAQHLVLDRTWKNINEIRHDDRGNDIRPRQEELPMWLELPLKDRDGLYNRPYGFYLTKGRHTLGIRATKADFVLSYIKIYNKNETPDYQKAYTELKTKGFSETSGFFRKIQGEDAEIKSNSTLYPTCDRSSSATEPSDPTKIRYNTIGQNTWQKSGQWITWSFEVPEDGAYEIGMRVRQDVLRGMFSNRRIYIDGEVPFKELDSVRFPYSTDWYMKILGNDKPYLFYLKKGTHEIKVEAVPGDIADTMKRLDDVIYDLNNYYRKILMITGPNPDQYRDYYIDQQIPGLLDRFSKDVEILYNEKEKIDKLTGQKGNDAVALERMALMLESFIQKPDTIPSRLEPFKNNISYISNWMLTGRDQPLEIDYIVVKSPDMVFPEAKNGFFSALLFNIKSFWGSFIEDYSIISNEKGPALNVWVSQGRDQAQVIKEMIDSEFFPQTGIHVNINLVQGSLLEATLAGRGPDVALFIGGDLPVNLAARGTLVDLKQIDDFEQVKGRFSKQGMVPYEHNDGCYALPVSQSFPMLFYRKDVLQELKIKSAPDTWNDFYDALGPVLRNYMSVGLVVPSVQVATTADLGDTFATLLLQKGLNYYNEDMSVTNFNKPEAVDSFTQWTKFYTSYNFPKIFDLFSRFRTGEMPIAVASYTFYNQLSVGAPEIKGLWGMAPVPGTIKADGSIDHSTNFTGTGAVIFNKVKDRDAAWEFLKWFTETDTQTSYSRAIEALMGPAGRFDTANVKALEKLPWSQEEYNLLKEQEQYIKGIPVIPSSYSVTRNLYNAFRKVTNDNENPRETLNWYNRVINDEIRRKRLELGLK